MYHLDTMQESGQTITFQISDAIMTCADAKNYPIIYKHKVIPYRYDTDGTMTADIYCHITAKIFLMRLQVFISFQHG